jgi:hypothetical protein
VKRRSKAASLEMLILQAAFFLALCARLSSGVTVRHYNEIFRTDLDTFDEFSSRYLTHFEMLENEPMTNTNILLGVSTPEVGSQKHRTCYNTATHTCQILFTQQTCATFRLLSDHLFLINSLQSVVQGAARMASI